MAIDREATLTKAAKLLRGGRPDAAIAAYARVVDDDPTDWNTAKTLGDLYVREGQPQQAVVLYGRIADHLLAQGLVPRAAALFKKILEIVPDHDYAQLRLAALDPEGPDAAASAASSRATSAVDRRRDQYEQYIEEGRYDDARRLIEEAARAGPASRTDVLALGWTYSDSNPDAAAICVDVVTDALVADGAYAEAAAVLEESAARMPNRVTTLLRLVEVCLDGGLEDAMLGAQAQLADAYLVCGRAKEARVIAEDLVNRDPSNAGHLARLQRSQQGGADDAEPVITLTASLEIHPHANAAAPVHVQASSDAPAARGESVEIDLTSMVGELQSRTQDPPPAARPRELDEVFADIRTEVSGDEAADASAEHMALAGSYLEMGMLAEAANSLEAAARSPHVRFTAARMLGEIRREEGNLPEAIEWFERAAEAPPPGPDEGRALLYDLGDVLETVGETARALAVFLELDADAPEYRDVRDRVARLAQIETEG